MPIYEYKCVCGDRQEIICEFEERMNQYCECGKILQWLPSGFSFKGIFNPYYSDGGKLITNMAQEKKVDQWRCSPNDSFLDPKEPAPVKKRMRASDRYCAEKGIDKKKLINEMTAKKK